VMAPNRPKWCK